jgi:hypothetical protein
MATNVVRHATAVTFIAQTLADNLLVMPRASTKITKEMGIYEQAAYQAASAEPARLPKGSERVEVMTTQMDPAQMRALLEQAAPAPVAPAAQVTATKRPQLWLPLLLVALLPALVYLAIHHR